VERALHVDYAAFPGEHGQLTVLSIRGAADLASEHTTAIETGYRIEPRADLLVDIAAFHNRYSHLRTERRSVLFETTPGPPHLSILRQYSSGMSGESVGLETLVRWQVRPNWRLDAGYDWLHTTLSNIGDTPEATLMSNRNPEHQVRVKSWLTMGRGWQLDACVAYTGRLQSVDVPGYVRGDVRLGGPIARGIDLSVIGQNLLDPHHREFDGFEGVFLTHTRRNLSVRLTVDF